MNIFITSNDPTACAQALDDLRLNKMILETAQLLSGAARLLFKQSEETIPDLYKLTHQNHPCAIWARKNTDNFSWLLRHFKALRDEKLFRTSVDHLSYTKLYHSFANLLTDDYLAAEPVFDFNCSIYPGKVDDVHEAYRKTMINKWSVIDYAANRIPKWIKRGRPVWYDNDKEMLGA